MIRNVWLVIGSLQAGGAERQICQMANYWSAKGVSVTVATWSGPSVRDFYALDDRVRRVHMKVAASDRWPFVGIRHNLRRIARLRTLLMADRPEVVLSFISESNVLTLLAARGLRIPVVISERVNPGKDVTVPAVWRALRRITYGWSDEVVVQTRDAAGWIERRCGKRAIVIPNALRALPDPPLRRESLIVAVGRLAAQKGFDVLLNAFAKVAHEFPQWRLAIIGEGRERTELQSLRDRLRLEHRVEFVGQVQNVETWLARAALVVQPSRFEGFPNAVLESMGMGAAVISADCQSGPAELIEDGVNGRLVPVENVSALAAVMADLMAREDVRAQLGLQALKVRDQFQQERIMAKWEASLARSAAAIGRAA